ncbi:MAG: glycosyltransferase family 1 protein [Acidithiobacillus sp.]
MTAALLRITLVTETYPPEINGVAITLGRAVEALRQRGHEVRVIRPRQAHEAPDVGLVTALPLFFYRQVKLGWVSPLTIRAWLQAWRSEVVHIATEGPLGCAALFAARQLHIPVVTSFHTNFDQYFGWYGAPFLSRLARAYLRHFHNATQQTLVPSEGTLIRLGKQGFQRLRRWGRGVDCLHFHPRWRDESLRGRLGLGPKDLLLLYVGRLAREKNLPPLLAGFRTLHQHLPTTALVLVGDGPLREEFNDLTHEGIHCVGVQRGSDLARWYASADIFCFPSCSETFGNVVLEAQSSGLPVIAYHCPGVDEQVNHGVHGILLPRGSEWQDALQTLCTHTEQRHQFAQAGRQRAESQSWSRSFDILEAVYREQVDKSQNRSVDI